MEWFELNECRSILGEKFDELLRVAKGVDPVSHEGFVYGFRRAGWSTEEALLGRYRLDAFKDGVAVEIESVEKSSVIDVLHRDFFRFLILFRMGKIRAAVIITRRAGGEVSLEKAKQDLALFGKHYEVPLLIMGV